MAWLLSSLLLAFLLPCPAWEQPGADEMSLLSLRPRKSPSAAVANRSQGCGKHRGIFWRYDHSRWQKAFSLHSWQTLEVLPSRSLSLWLCSVHNGGGGGSYAWPALVGSVGAGGSVEVVVEDSFNERSGGELNISTSLVPPVQLGALGPRADVEVSLKGSGNVEGFGALHVPAGGQLVAPVISAGRLEGGEVTVTMEDCGNVRGGGWVSVAGSLLSPLASAGEVEGTELSASSKGCGNVEARRLEVEEGRLASASLEIKGASGAKLEVKMEEVGGFQGKEALLQEGGALVAGLLNVSEGRLRRSRVHGEMEETAVLQAEVANLSEAMLVEAAFRLPGANVSGGSMKLTVKSSAALKGGRQLEMKGGAFMRQAIYAREGAVAFRDSELHLELEEVSMVEAKEVSLSDYAALLWAALHVDEVVADGGSLDLRLHRVGECRARAAGLAGYLAYGVVLTESFTAESRSKLDVRVADSFNCYVEGDLSVQRDHVRNVLFGDWLLSKASIEVESSLNRKVGGELEMGGLATVIRDVHRGEARNSSFNMGISESMNSKVGGSLQLAGEPLVEDIVDGVVENGSYTVRLEDSVNLEAGGDLLLKGSGSMFLRSVFDGIELGSLGVTLRRSLNVDVGGTATIQSTCYLASNLIFDDFRNASLTMEVEDSANVKAVAVIMGNGYLIGQLVDGNVHRHSSMSISVRRSANVKAASLSMSSSQLLGEVIDDDVDNCSVKARLEDVANVEATYLSLQSDSSLVRQVLSSDEEGDGSVLEAKCSNMAKVTASNVSLSNSALVQKGYYTEAFSSSELRLSFDDVANVIGRRAAYLQGSALIKSLFHVEDSASGTLKAWLLKSSSLESEAATRLVQSSLLGKAVSGVVDKLELHLGVTSTGLLCRSGKEGGIVASVDNVDSPLCADGPGLVTADSCEARFCSI